MSRVEFKTVCGSFVWTVAVSHNAPLINNLNNHFFVPHFVLKCSLWSHCSHYNRWLIETALIIAQSNLLQPSILFKQITIRVLLLSSFNSSRSFNWKSQTLFMNQLFCIWTRRINHRMISNQRDHFGALKPDPKSKILEST